MSKISSVCLLLIGTACGAVGKLYSKVSHIARLAKP